MNYAVFLISRVCVYITAMYQFAPPRGHWAARCTRNLQICTRYDLLAYCPVWRINWWFYRFRVKIWNSNAQYDCATASITFRCAQTLWRIQWSEKKRKMKYLLLLFLLIVTLWEWINHQFNYFYLLLFQFLDFEVRNSNIQYNRRKTLETSLIGKYKK